MNWNSSHNLGKFLLTSYVLVGACASLLAQLDTDVTAYREKHLAALVADPRKPLGPGEEKLLRYFPIRKGWRISARYEILENEPVLQMPTYSGITREYRKYARVSFKQHGQRVILFLYQNISLIRQPGYRDYLFLPFRDPTNGHSTYGGGRYMDIRAGDAREGKITLDFNKAYNPYCAYNDGFNCPIPPQENHLKLAIRAGERHFVRNGGTDASHP